MTKINPDILSFFVGLMFGTLTIIYDRYCNERLSGSSSAAKRLGWLVRTLCVCSTLGFVSIISAVVNQWWELAYLQELAAAFFVVTVICAFYVVIVFFSMTALNRLKLLVVARR